jgi:preprotein translocase subunit SecD
MRQGTLTLLLFIVLLAAGALFVNFWPNHPLYGITNPSIIHEGLDLKGGVRVLLVPDPSQHYTLQQIQQAIGETRNQIESRVNGGLGVSEPSIRIQTSNNGPSISVELPGLTSGNQTEQVKTLLQAGKLEFWDTGPSQQGGILPDGFDFNPTNYKQYNPTGLQPLFTGKDLDPSQLAVRLNDSGTGKYVIAFAMKQGPAFGGLSDFTAKHIGDALTITLDRKVITSANIESQLPGSGQITGNFTLQEAQSLVSVLKYGALPLALVIDSEETVGATLGQDSILRSEIAAAIGLSIVVLFMLLYYRLPGLLADFALVLYALFTFAIFKIIPGFTLTLPGIAGFILSIGMAVDANILIFERVKEELRAGRLLASAIDIGWKRAWPSIRDSNISTLITCAVLYGFGSNFGATIIVGFASTLFLGVVISMFTAIVVTRTFLNLLVPTGVVSHPALFGLPAGSIATSSLARANSRV